MDAPAIRPRTAIEIVDAAFALFRDNFATMAIIGLSASVPLVALAVLGAGVYTPSWSRAFTNPIAFLSMTATGGVAALVVLLWLAVVDGAMTYAAAEAYHGNRPTPQDALRGAFSKGLSLVGGNILRMVIVFGGLLLMGVVFSLVGSGINGFFAVIMVILALVLCAHLFARTFAITSAIVIERRTAAEGVTRSFILSRDATGRIIGVFLLCGAIYIVARAAGSMLVHVVMDGILHSPVMTQIVASLVGMLMYPFMNIGLMVLYFDQRVRREGYDLDVLSNAMPAAPAGQP